MTDKPMSDERLAVIRQRLGSKDILVSDPYEMILTFARDADDLLAEVDRQQDALARATDDGTREGLARLFDREEGGRAPAERHYLMADGVLDVIRSNIQERRNDT